MSEESPIKRSTHTFRLNHVSFVEPEPDLDGYSVETYQYTSLTGRIMKPKMRAGRLAGLLLYVKKAAGKAYKDPGTAESSMELAAALTHQQLSCEPRVTDYIIAIQNKRWPPHDEQLLPAYQGNGRKSSWAFSVISDDAFSVECNLLEFDWALWDELVQKSNLGTESASDAILSALDLMSKCFEGEESAVTFALAPAPYCQKDSLCLKITSTEVKTYAVAHGFRVG